VKTEPIQTDEGFIGSDIFLTENQSKPNRYTPTPKLSFPSKRYTKDKTTRGPQNADFDNFHAIQAGDMIICTEIITGQITCLEMFTFFHTKRKVKPMFMKGRR
jgi:hypothetical protein